MNNTLQRIERKVDQLSTDVTQLDNALDTLGGDVSALRDAVNALIAAIPAGVDLSAEVQKVKDAFASIENTTQQVVDATPQPPAGAAAAESQTGTTENQPAEGMVGEPQTPESGQ